MPLRLPSPVFNGMRIGLLGGSFNPAHDGHRHISLIALRRLNLHQVWWLVSPQNPLKPTKGMAPLAERMQTAKSVANHPRILVTDIERQLATTYTANTLEELSKRVSRAKLVWIMGADNLADFHRWKDWNKIFGTVPIAVIARPGYAHAALSAPAARRFAASRLDANDSSVLADRPAPAWVYIQEDLHPESATAIRQREG